MSIAPTINEFSPKRTTIDQRSPLWPSGLLSGLAAGIATSIVAVVARVAGRPLTMSGKVIPISAFVTFTVVGGLLGVGIAKLIMAHAHRPRAIFIRTTVVLTALSIIPDVVSGASGTTKVVLVATHLLAAAIIVPAIASRVPVSRSDSFPSSSGLRGTRA